MSIFIGIALFLIIHFGFYIWMYTKEEKEGRQISDGLDVF